MPVPLPSRTRRSAGLLVLALLGFFLIAGPAVEPAAAATPPVDISGTMPKVTRGEVTYDFLGKGYDQRLVAEDGKLNLYEPPGRGGNSPVTSVTLDLVPPPFVIGTNADPYVMYDPVSYAPQRAQDIGINTINLVVLDGWLYISGANGSTDQPTYRNSLYKVPLDLSCADRTCAQRQGKVIDLPSYYDNADTDQRRIIGTTSMAGGFAGGNPYLAVGLTDWGAYIYDTNLRQVSVFNGMGENEYIQTPVTALAWDPAGSGTVAVGTMQDGTEGYIINIAADGSIPTGHRWNFLGWGNLRTVPVSVSFGRQANGTLIAAYGVTGGVDPAFPASLFFVDPTAPDNANPLGSIAVPGNGVTTVQAVPRTDGTAGDDFAVWSEAGFGSLIRYDQRQPSFLPLEPPTATTPNQLDTPDEFRSWFPGYKTGRFSVQNTLPEPVTVTLQTRPQAGYGCWYAPAFAHAPGFPASPVTVQPGQSSSVFTMGGVTAGPQGRCGATDITGDIRGYLVVTPVSRPADARIVNLQLEEETMSLDVASDQVGGSTAVSATLTPAKGAAFGTWQVSVGGPAAPTPLAAPTIAQARRITTASRQGTTVYRVDVNGTRWSVPGATAASPQIQAVIPPLQVQGSIDGTNWTTLGSFLPPGQLSLSGTTLTTGGGSFFWENPAGQPAYRQLRVLAGTLASTPVVLNGLPAPTPPSPTVSQLQLTVTKNPGNATANVVPNGLDQAQVEVQISAGGSLLPTTNPVYDTVFYRDEDNDLITNLYQPGEFDQFVGAQPAAGAYPNSGVSTVRRVNRPGVGAGLSYDYVSTNSLSERSITGWVGAGPNGSNSTAPLTLNEEALDITPDPAGKAGVGFSLEGCTDFTSGESCVVAGTGRPALYQAGSDATGPLLGAHLQYQAQNAVSDLPLEWQTQFGAQDLATSGLTVTNRATLIKLSNPNGYLPGNDVDLIVVSHGETVAATVPVS